MSFNFLPFDKSTTVVYSQEIKVDSSISKTIHSDIANSSSRCLLISHAHGLLIEAFSIGLLIFMSLFLNSSTQKHVDALHDKVLLWIVRMLLRRNLQHGWNGFVVILQNMSNIIGNVLIDEDNPDITASRKVFESLLYLWQLRVLLNDQKVARVGSAMAHACQQKACDSILVSDDSD